MEENNLENHDSEIVEPENTDSSTGETEAEVVEEESAEEATTEPEKEEYSEREKQYYNRIKNLEKKLKEKESENNVVSPQESTSSVSTKDVLALTQAGITAEDYDEVVEFAKYKKIDVLEAIKSPVLKTILNDKKEERRTAEATATKSPRGIAKTTGEDLLKKVEKNNEMPTSQKDIDALVQARLDRKRKK